MKYCLSLMEEHSIDEYLLYFEINYVVYSQCPSNGLIQPLNTQ